jgi:hypothetical protein
MKRGFKAGSALLPRQIMLSRGPDPKESLILQSDEIPSFIKVQLGHRSSTGVMRSVLVIPNRIHTKSRLLDITMSNPGQKLLIPPINLDPALLIIRQSHPFITPITRTDRVGVTAARWGRVQTYLALNVSRGAEFEGRDVAGECGRVGARGGVEIISAVG